MSAEDIAQVGRINIRYQLFPKAVLARNDAGDKPWGTSWKGISCVPSNCKIKSHVYLLNFAFICDHVRRYDVMPVLTFDQPL